MAPAAYSTDKPGGGHMGSKKYKPSKEQQELSALQAEELRRTKKKEGSRKAALERSRRGRASLISGSEQGVTGNTLGG